LTVPETTTMRSIAGLGAVFAAHFVVVLVLR